MDTWRGLTLDMVEYKSIYKMRSTEDLYAALEDHAVSLSAMKASRFFPVFEATILEWEKKLSQVSEVVELVLQVRFGILLLHTAYRLTLDLKAPRRSGFGAQMACLGQGCQSAGQASI